MTEAKRVFYPLRLAQEASSITAFKDTHKAASEDNDLFEYPILAGPLALFMGTSEFVLPATMRFIRENGNDEYRPLRTLLLSVGAMATDVVTNGLIVVAGLDSGLNIAARKIVLNYATHMGIDFIQKIFPDQHAYVARSYTPQFVERSAKVRETLPQPSVTRTRRPTTKPIPEKPRSFSKVHPTLTKPVESVSVIGPNTEEPSVPAGDLLEIKTLKRGLLLRDKAGELKRDPEGRILAEFPGPPKYTARIPEGLIGTKYQMIDDKSNTK